MMTPTLVTPAPSAVAEGASTALPPEGAFAPGGGPSALTPPLLDVKKLSVSFVGKEVVRGIDFHVAPGEKLALVGESGSGKTVTALSLLRLAQNASVRGQAWFGGRDLLALSGPELMSVRGQDIAMIFQEPMTALNPLITVGAQIAEVLTLKMGMDKRSATDKAVELLAETGIAEPQRRAGSFAHQLSGGQRQRAMIAMALACRPKLLLADEPTTALDVTLRAQILDLLSDLQKQNGMAVLMITHDLNLVRRFADRIAVMEAGHIVEQGAVGAVFATAQHAYTRKLIDSKPVRDVLEVSAIKAGASTSASPSMLRARALQVAYPVRLPGFRGWFKSGRFIAVDDVGFELVPGQTLGGVGESGSGKSTLAMAALGLLPHAGELEALGRRWAAGQGHAARAMRREIQVVFQDPFSSLSPRMTVEEIVGEGLLTHQPALSRGERQSEVLRALREVGLEQAQHPALLQRYPHEFSGGQRQRIAVARALILGPKVLVLDEPTSALDVTVQKQVLQLLQRLQRERALSYLLITHDVDVIRAMAHHVLVMKDGRIVESGPVDVVLGRPREDYTRRLVAAAA